LGALVQSITGFAMGLIIMGGVTALGVAEIAFSAAVVSLISMVNAAVALRHTYKFVDIHIWTAMIAGLIPLTIAGVLLLELFSARFYEIIQVMLGVVIIGAGTSLMIQPRPFEGVSSRPAVAAVGGLGGVIGGLYGAGGAPLAWFMYRQPLELNVIRATLLATFLVSTSGRAVVVGFAGHLTKDVLLTALLAVPMVILVTLAGARLAPHVPDKLIRRFVFILLILLGATLMFRRIGAP
jgi:uncharacterized membrane protein YfcA